MENDILNLTKEGFGLKDMTPEEVSPLILAHIGDAIYEVVVRTIVLSGGNKPINLVHRDSIKFVNARTQADLAEILQEEFTQEEAVQYRRGKNAKPKTSAKNATLQEYHVATGLEAVMGFLYLKGKNDRIIELCKLGFEKLGLV